MRWQPPFRASDYKLTGTSIAAPDRRPVHDRWFAAFGKARSNPKLHVCLLIFLSLPADCPILDPYFQGRHFEWEKSLHFLLEKLSPLSGMALI